MEFPSFNHQNRYVACPPNYSDDRNFYHQHQHQHHRLPPPNSFSVLPPAPPPPYNAQHPQFTFLSRQHENPRLPPPRVSHRDPFQYQDSWQNPPRVISPYHPTQSFNIGSNSRFTDPFLHNSYRDDNVISNSNNILGGGGDHHYMPNSNRSVKGFEFGTGSSYNNNNKNVDFGRNLSDERWVHAPMKLENNEFEDGDGVQSRRVSKVFASPEKFSNRSRESREEFVPSPKKQIQKKSVLLRIGRPNNRNRTRILTFKGKDKDKDPGVYSEEETVGSPVELDVSFKSNSLVAKPIMTPSSSATGSDRKISSSNRKTRKPNLSFSPIIKFAERLAKSENSKQGSDCPSSSDKGRIQSPEKVTVSSGTSDSAGSSALKGSPEGKIAKQVDNDGATDETPPRRVRKRKKVEPSTSEVSSLQTTKKDDEPFNADSSTNIPSAPDQGLMHTKEKITSAGMVMVHGVASLRTPNELTVKKVDESPMQAISSEKDDAEIDSTRSCVPETKTPDTKTNSSTHLLGYSSTTEIEINGNTETEERLVHNLQFVSKFDEVLNELQAESIISNTDRVDDVCPQLANDIVTGSSVRIVSVGDNGSVDFSRLEEIRSCKGIIDAHDPAHVPCNDPAHVPCNDFNRRQENIIVSGFNSADTGPKQSSFDDASTAELETSILKESRDLFYSVGSNGALGLPNAEEDKFHEGATNVDCSNHDSANTTSSSHTSPTNLQADNIVSDTYDFDGTSKQPFVDVAKILLENGLVEGSLKLPKVLLGDKPNVSSGKDSSSPKERRKRKVRDIQLGLSSPNTSNISANAVSCVRDVDTTLSYTFKDLVSTEEEVRNLNISNEGSSEVEVLIRGAVNGGPNRISPQSKKKRKVFATDEKPKAEDILNDSVDNSKSNMPPGPAKVSDISMNTQTASHSSHGTNKTIQSLNTKGELNLTRNQSRSAVSSVISGRSSLVLPRKTTPISQSAKPRTWHRTGDPSTSPLPPRISPKKVGKFQSSYIRKGNSLVRKPTPVTNLPRASLSPSVYRLNSSVIDQTKKSSGSVSKVDVINPVKTDGSNNASFERPKTPPLQLNCTIDHSGDFAYLPLANHPSSNDCSETTTLDRLELTENVNALKFSEDPLKYSGTLENQTAPVNSMESHRVLDEGSSGKKIIYVKRKLNQLVAAASNSSDQSAQDVDTTQALSSDGYYKRRKNQLIRTSVEGHKIIAVPDDTSEEQRVPEVISSKRFSKRQFGKGLAKLYKPSKFSSVWRLCNAQSSRKLDNSIQGQKAWPHLFPWKRATYWRSYMHNSSPPISNNSSLSQISRKLLLSRKRDTIYTRSTHGFSLRMSKLLSVGGSSLKWSKSIEQDSKRANEEATLAVAAVQKKKREQNGAAVTCVVAGGTKRRNHFPRERIFRIGAVRYRMDPTRRTLQRISEKEPSSSASLQFDKNAKKSYVPKRLVIGNDEYVRIGNGNQLVRDPKKRTRILASEKVRWSLHTARLRLARKMTYCQFFTRFGTCNKDAGKCPYIHDPSKIAVCTKFLSGSCSNPNCKLTHKVIPERMQDCSYFLQGLCSNKICPYRHVNVNPNASICEGFLKGFCADGDECPKKHTYVCPVFEATGTCPQGSKCKLHHPKNRTKGMKRKPLRVQKNARGRYFGGSRNNIDIAELKASSENRYSKYDDEGIFSQEGKFTDYIALDVSDEEVEETIETTANQRTLFANINNSDLQVADIGELTKPIKIMGKSNDRMPPSVDRQSERTVKLGPG